MDFLGSVDIVNQGHITYRTGEFHRTTLAGEAAASAVPRTSDPRPQDALCARRSAGGKPPMLGRRRAAVFFLEALQRRVVGRQYAAATLNRLYYFESFFQVDLSPARF